MAGIALWLTSIQCSFKEKSYFVSAPWGRAQMIKNNFLHVAMLNAHKGTNHIGYIQRHWFQVNVGGHRTEDVYSSVLAEII